MKACIYPIDVHYNEKEHTYTLQTPIHKSE